MGKARLADLVFTGARRNKSLGLKSVHLKSANSSYKAKFIADINKRAREEFRPIHVRYEHL